MRYLYIRHNASIMAMSIICPPEGPLDTVLVSGDESRTSDTGRMTLEGSREFERAIWRADVPYT